MLLADLPRRRPAGASRLETKPPRAKKVHADPLERYRAARRLLDESVVGSQAELAGFLRVTRARVSQLMSLDRVHPDVWEWLQCAGAPYRDVVSENLLREIARRAPEHQLAVLRMWCGWLRH